MLHVEEPPLNEQAPAYLLEVLERRLEDVLAYHARARRQAEAAHDNGSRLEHENRRLLAELETLRAAQGERDARLAQLERQAVEAEAMRLELVEENRELDEQNRELEGHGRHLQERLVQAGAAEAPPRPSRQSKGLSALMGHHRDTAQAAAEPAPQEAPVAPVAPVKEIPAQEASVKGAPGAEPAASEPVEREAPSPQALLEQWYGRYDGAFFKGHTRPLKVGIHEDLAALEPWPEKLVRRALACYVNLPRYLKAVRDGAERIDAAGHPAGRVDESAATHARRKLERLQSERLARQGAKAGAAGKRGKHDNSGKGERGRGRDSRKRRAGDGSPRPSDQETKQTGHQAKHQTKQAPHQPGPTDGAAKKAAQAAHENPDDRMQRKLDALMARHSFVEKDR